MIQGGWSFVAWAYGLAYGGLALYGLSLWRRIGQQAHIHSHRSSQEEEAP